MAELSQTGKILRLVLKQLGARWSDREPNQKARTVGQALTDNVGSLDKHLAAAGIPREPPKPAQEKIAPAAPASGGTVRDFAEDFRASLRSDAEAFRKRELLGERAEPSGMIKDTGAGTETGKAVAPQAGSSGAPATAVPKGLTKSATVGFGRVTTDGAAPGSSAGPVNTAGPRRGIGRDTSGNELNQSLDK